MHDGHDAGVKRELQDDAADGSDAFVDLFHVLHGRLEQQHTQEQDEKVDHVQIKVAALVKVQAHVAHTAQANQQAERAAVVQARGEGLLITQQFTSASGRLAVLCGGDGIQFHHFFTLLGVHGCIEQRQSNQHRQAGQQNGQREDGFCQRNQPHGAFKGVAFGGDQHRNGGGKTQAVHREPGVGRGNDQRVVHALDFERQLARHDAANHQTKAPVQVAAHAAHDGGHDDGLTWRVHMAGNFVHEAIDDGRGSQHIAHHQDDSHLGGKAQQAPKALAPVLHHQIHGAAFHGKGQHHGQQGEHDREDERVGQILAHQLREERGDF